MVIELGPRALLKGLKDLKDIMVCIEKQNRINLILRGPLL
jgi:hypothetical protein